MAISPRVRSEIEEQRPAIALGTPANVYRKYESRRVVFLLFLLANRREQQNPGIIHVSAASFATVTAARDTEGTRQHRHVRRRS